MPLDTKDADNVRVKHMIDAAKEAISFIRNKRRDDLKKDRKLVLSLIKEIEIIGEAASKVSEKFRKKHPDIPWSVIVGTRNRLIHGYFDVDIDIVWITVSNDLPKLIELLRKSLH